MKVKKIFLAILLTCSSFALFGQSVGLVLSGGGAKGLSHVGLIKALEENNIPIDYVAGTSMGAIVGAFYAIGLSPDEMLSIFKSDAYQSWYRGLPERDYESFLYRESPTSEMIKVNLAIERDKEGKFIGIKPSVPLNVVSPYPMDIAVLQIFGSAAAAADYDFDKLMVPFLCVSADVLKKQQVVLTSGDLGSAVRSSMTFPGYFKPIEIDSVLLFDGGFYNNFPWEQMKERFYPDFIIGGKCVKGEALKVEDDNPIAMLELMMTIDTDYLIPENEGLVIGDVYNYSIMDFDKVDAIVEQGYKNALKYIPTLKQKIKNEISPEELNEKRLAFRKKCIELKFDEVIIDGDMKDKEKEYLANTVRAGLDTFDFAQAKRGYYRVVASNTVNTWYPTSKINKDSLFTLKIKASKKSVMSVGIGGNISSGFLNQAHLGVSGIFLGEYPLRASMNLDIGQFYTGANINFRQDFSKKYDYHYNAEIVAHSFDYFEGNKGGFMHNTVSSNIRESECYGSVKFGFPVSMRYWFQFNLGLTMGANIYSYYPNPSFSKYDAKDKSFFMYVSPRLWLEQNTLNFKHYPTEGSHRILDFRYIYGTESFTPGTMTDKNLLVKGKGVHSLLFDLNIKQYYSLSKWLSLGVVANIVASKPIELADYTSTLLMSPVFTPTVHSKTLLLGKYRASSYAAVGISPIFKITKNIHLHTSASYFQPYKELIEGSNGSYSYSDPFPDGKFMASAALVWQSPLGPISLSCSYYSHEQIQWYPQLNIGYLIFRNRALRN